MLSRALPLLIVLVVAGAGLATHLPRATRAGETGVSMRLTVTGAGTTCDDVSEPSQCSAPLGGMFTVDVQLPSAPEGGYAGVQSELYYGGLFYQADDPAQETVWPDASFITRSPPVPVASDRLVAHASATSLTPPFPASAYSGPLVRLTLVCSSSPSLHTVALLPYDDAARPFGAGVQLAGPGGDIGSALPAATIGQRQLDLDGDLATEAVDVAWAVDVSCGASATATPPASPSATATILATATRTATPPAAGGGDANCSGRVDSVDAALVLQLTAGLLPSLSCAQAADTNLDGRVNALDAALILQFVAGLLEALPAA